MINLPLTDEVMNIARYSLAQARLKDCDCDTPCSCLAIVEVTIDVDAMIITTARTEYTLRATWRRMERID